jgi:tetratricopeptide (TPR) repeat protein
VIRRETGDRAGEARTLDNLGIAYERLGRYGEAVTYHEAAVAIRRAIGDRAGEAESVGNLGFVYSRLGRCAEALAHHEAALALGRDEIRHGAGVNDSSVRRRIATTGPRCIARSRLLTSRSGLSRSLIGNRWSGQESHRGPNCRAVSHARDHGASAVEGHPVDVDKLAGTSVSGSALFTGTLAMLVDAGFTEIARTFPSRPVMRLQL